MEETRNNIILIGMPGVGKSAVGKELAQKLGMNFLDVDEYIQIRENKKLQEIINETGDEGFVETEKNHIFELNLSNYVISTGGSVVLNEETMERLKKLGILVFLDTPLEILKARLRNLDERGVVGLRSGMTLEKIFNLRQPLYKKYADITVNLPSELPLDETVNILAATLRNYEKLRKYENPHPIPPPL